MNRIGDRALIWTAILMLLFVLWALGLMRIGVKSAKGVEKTLITFNKHFHDHTHDFEGIVGKKKTGGVNYDEKSKVNYKPYER